MKRGVFPLLLLALGCQHVPAPSNPATDFDRDLAEIDVKLLRESTCPLLLKRASLSNDYRDFKKVELCIQPLKARDEASYLLKAFFFSKIHRVRDAKRELTELSEHFHSERVQSAATPMLADVAFSLGNYDEAEKGYKKSLEYHRSWDSLARYSHFNLKMGNPALADQLLSEAREKIPANEMRSFAWIELQRGIIRLEYQKYEEALKYFQRANEEYSGYPLIEEHMAETLRLLGRVEESKAIYRRVIEKTRDPQFMAAMISLESDPTEAAKWREKAKVGFDEQLRLFSEAASGHMLDFLLEDPSTDPRLLSLAKKNYENRPNGEAAVNLARAYLKVGQPSEAERLLKKVLKTRWRTPDLFEAATQVALRLNRKKEAAAFQSDRRKLLDRLP